MFNERMDDEMPHHTLNEVKSPTSHVYNKFQVAQETKFKLIKTSRKRRNVFL